MYLPYQHGRYEMAIKAKREGGLWVITAIVGGNVEEFAGFRLRQAIELFYRAQERAGSAA